VRTQHAVRLGTVSRFDGHRGLGEVTDREGFDYLFHCTAITDGTRSIAVGTKVEFVLVPGHLGRLEAARLSVAGRPGVSS
jgi:cold shock protein